MKIECAGCLFILFNFFFYRISILNKYAILVKWLLKLSTFANDYNSFSVHFYESGMSYRLPNEWLLYSI